MRITPVGLSYNRNANIAEKQKPNNTKADNSAQNSDYASKTLTKGNKPAFGSYILDDIYYFTLRTLNEEREKSKDAQIRAVKQMIMDDTDILSRRLGVSKETAQKMYEEYLEIGAIQPTYYGKEQGLNKIMGYSKEKLDLIKNVVVPIVVQVKNTREGKELPPDLTVPNGVLLYGPPRTGKSYMADALLEHLNKKDAYIYTEVINSPWYKGETDENIESIMLPFEEAEKKHKEEGAHTIIYIDNFDGIFSIPDNELVQGEFEFQSKNAAEKGITWIATTNSLKELPGWFFNPKRLSLEVPVKKVASDIEKSATISYFIASMDRKDKTNHDRILDYIEKARIPFYPPFINKVMDKVDSDLSETKDYGCLRTGNYHAPVETEQVIKTFQEMNEKEKKEKNVNNNQDQYIIDGLDDEIYIERKKAKYDKGNK